MQLVNDVQFNPVIVIVSFRSMYATLYSDKLKFSTEVLNLIWILIL